MKKTLLDETKIGEFRTIGAEMKGGRGKNKFSLRQIANRLNEKVIPTKRGGKWYAGTVRYILHNSRYREVKQVVSV